MKYIFPSTTLIILLAIITFSCSNNKNAGFIKSNNGTHYKVYYQGNDSSKAVESEIVTVNLDYRIGDSVIFNSNTLSKPMKFPIIKPVFKGDLYDALMLMGTGDSITVRVVADSFYLKTANLPKLPNYVVPGSYLYYDVKLLKHISHSDFQNEMIAKYKKQRKRESAVLQSYLVSNKINVDPTKSGLYFIPIKRGNGSTPDTGNMCQVFLSVKQLNGEELFNNFGGRALDIEYGKKFDTKGFMEGLGMLKPGGEAQLIVPSWIGVGNTGRETVAPFTTLIYKVELKAIRTLDEVKKDRKQYKKDKERADQHLKLEESEKISNYLNKNNIKIIPLKSGLYIKELVAGNGSKPVDGDTVTINYVQYDLDGNIIQSSYADNSPFTFVVGTGAVIAGWEEAVKLMRKDGKSWMLLPSKIGWGDRVRNKKIQPYSPLVFELEVVDVK